MLTLVYSLFGALCGWLEAILYARRGAETFSSNEHGGMMLQRVAAVLIGAAAVVDYHLFGVWLLVAELIPTALLFPLFHDEAYNFTRLWIASADSGQVSDRAAWRLAWAQYRYGYQSATTTARFDFDGRERTWLALAGVLVLAAEVFIAQF